MSFLSRISVRATSAEDKQAVMDWVKDNDVDVHTISFYSKDAEDDDDEGGEVEGHFGTCDITGVKGNVVPCQALTKKGKKKFEFEAGDWLVHGPLGKLAGAF